MRRRLWLLGGLVLVAVIAIIVRAQRSTDGDATIHGGSIVLLGDSITAGGDWATLLPDHPIVNRGFPGFTTEELVGPAEAVASANPRAVLILTGTNDIRDGHSPGWTVDHLGSILDRFAELAPDTEMTIQSVLPRADAPDAVEAVNRALDDLAAERHVAWLDLHPLFDDGTGGLRLGDTTDGIHLAPGGYERWAEALRPVVEDLGR